MNQLHRIPFLVIGGGIGGLATALALCDGITALLRNALLSGRTPDDFTYADWFYGYQPERR